MISDSRIPTGPQKDCSGAHFFCTRKKDSARPLNRFFTRLNDYKKNLNLRIIIKPDNLNLCLIFIWNRAVFFIRLAIK